MQRYRPSAAEAWAPSALVTLQSRSGEVLGRVPLAFLEKASSSCSGATVNRIASILVVDPGHLERDGRVLGDPDEATPGVYIFVPHSGTSTRAPSSSLAAVSSLLLTTASAVALATGPQSKTMKRVFEDTSSEAGMSRSSRSSVNQKEFRFDLASRDGWCLVTGETDKHLLEACHVVPFSRGMQLLHDILGQDTYMDLFSPQNGLYLERGIHAAYDRYLWGVDTNGDEHTIHVFATSSLFQYHGMPLKYRSHDPRMRPDKQLLDWHYSQCVLARIRGFAVL